MAVEGLQHVQGAVSGLNDLATASGTSQGAIDALTQQGQKWATSLASDFNTIESAQGGFIAATGASTAEAELFTDSMRGLMGETTLAGIGMGKLAETGIAVTQQFQTTGEETSNLTKAFSEYAKVTKSDATVAVNSFDAALDAFGLPASEATHLMDMLVASNQEYGTVAGPKAVDTIARMAPALTAMGLGLDDAVALLNLFEAAGINADTAQRGLNTAITKLPPGESFDDVVRSLGEIENPADRAAAAIEIFGTTAGPKLAAAIQPGTTGLAEFAVGAEESEGATSEAAAALVTSADKMAAASDRMAAAALGMSEAIGPISTVAAEAAPALGGMATQLTGLKAGADIASGGIKLLSSGALKPLMALLVPGGKIVLAVGAALGGLKIAGNLASEGFNKAAEGAKNMTVASQEDAKALGIAEGAHRGMANVLNFVAPWSNAAKAAEGAAQAYEDQADSARESGYEVKSATDQIASAWAGAKTKIAGSLSGMVSDMRGMVGNVRSALSEFGDIGRNAAKSMIDGLVGGIQGGISRVQGAAQGVANKVKDIFRLGSPAKSGPWSKDGGPIAWMERDGRMMIDALNRGLGSGSINVPQLNAGSARGGTRGLAPITVNVYTGVGDPVAIGREVSNALRAYQRVAGVEA